MRVLDTKTGHFVDIDPKDRQIKYAILSHTWRPKGEQTYQQLRAIQKQYTPSADGNSYDDYSLSDDDSPPNTTSEQPLRPILDHPKLSSKIWEACRVARENGYRFLWIDSCCIDKTSSSELSESINSMYEWYALADVCYAFLQDVVAEEDHEAEGSGFRSSRWFTRGWTLQELIAPLEVVFLAKDWTVIGSKAIFRELIAGITNIDYKALLHTEPLEEFSIAQRFSWASNRVTTRVEDRAYSLLGIFDINIPTLYGEGERAFRRLQEEIMRRTPDQTLFAWTHFGLLRSLSNNLLYNPESHNIAKGQASRFPLVVSEVAKPESSLLAPSLDFFRKCEGIKALSHDEVLRRLQLTANNLPAGHYDFTPYGIHVQFPVIHIKTSNYFPPGFMISMNRSMARERTPYSLWYLIILGCEHRDFPGHLLGRVSFIQSAGPSIDLLYSGYIAEIFGGAGSDLLPVSPETITRLRVDSPAHISPKKLYIFQPPRNKAAGYCSVRDQPHARINLILPTKNRNALSAQGYTATLRSPHPDTHSITLAHNTHTISIEYQHTLESGFGPGHDQSLEIEARAKTLRGVHPVAKAGGQDTVVASWWDIPPWSDSLDNVDLRVDTPEGSRLSLGLSFVTTNYYALSIELKTDSQTIIIPAC